jgi:hypothetical protein
MKRRAGAAVADGEAPRFAVLPPRCSVQDATRLCCEAAQPPCAAPELALVGTATAISRRLRAAAEHHMQQLQQQAAGGAAPRSALSIQPMRQLTSPTSVAALPPPLHLLASLFRQAAAARIPPLALLAPSLRPRCTAAGRLARRAAAAPRASTRATPRRALSSFFPPEGRRRAAPRLSSAAPASSAQSYACERLSPQEEGRCNELILG